MNTGNDNIYNCYCYSVFALRSVLDILRLDIEMEVCVILVISALLSTIVQFKLSGTHANKSVLMKSLFDHFSFSKHCHRNRFHRSNSIEWFFFFFHFFHSAIQLLQHFHTIAMAFSIINTETEITTSTEMFGHITSDATQFAVACNENNFIFNVLCTFVSVCVRFVLC